ncbi:hypothetical protein [Neisseria weaveri]|uniref:hypothetical protein n=1 Tax=Neisseria weaveri TaxID=28091 RepID=UPI0007C9A157|nr:hypothetical protein [Neisseria weaveri]SAY50943.1 Uncharacterised protein [Neisseria weaveri]
MNIEQQRSYISRIVFPNEPEYIDPDAEFSICKKDNLIELARLFYEKYQFLPKDKDDKDDKDSWVLLIQLMFTANSIGMITPKNFHLFYQQINEYGCAHALKTLDHDTFYKYYMIAASYEKATDVLYERYDYYCRPDFLRAIPR